LSAARALRGVQADVLLVDRRNHHVFQPLLYQVATAGLSPGDISSPIRCILRKQRNLHVWLAEATRVDVDRRVLVLSDDEVPYDYLILAPGAAHAYFGHDEWREHAPGLKTLEDALEMRRRVLLAFEQAEREKDRGRQRRLLTFVVVGGGPTGVELAGALAEISRHALANDFREIDPESARVILIEGGPMLLSSYPEALSAFARRALERLGVAVWTGSVVTNVGPGEVHVGTEVIQAGTILWAAGVSASPLGESLGVPLDRAGRVLVQDDLSVPGHP
jgi:NADH dehydrogenase